MRLNWLLKLALLLLLGLWILWTRQHGAATKAGIVKEIASFSTMNWVCYAPTDYDPRRDRYPAPGVMRSDLRLLKSAGFDGVITYECDGPLERIADLAMEAGLLVIQGVWDPADREELDGAARLKEKVVAYCVGNEGLNTRYTIRELDQGMTYLSNKTGIPTTISEQIHLYFDHPQLIDMGDWLFPIVHPHFGEAKTFDSAMAWLQQNSRRLADQASAQGHSKLLFLKEVGMPSAGDSAYSESVQASFVDSVLKLQQPHLALFEAFDRKGWEYVSPVEPYWGIYRSDRTPKQAAVVLPQALAARTAGRKARGLGME